ncbi:MAG: EamA family transporter [Lachnospiraceae bacterium]|nr:EamA family transporter [Lachnospiraceae bacterium]
MDSISWFVLALISALGWGFADLFYKKGTDENDRYSHLRIAVWVGLVMGASAFCLLPFSETSFSIGGLLKNAVRYSSASLCYIISMVIGYAGLRYLELSIVSPVQNASGAFSAVAMIIFFSVTGAFGSILDELSALDIVGTVIITAALIALAFVENRISRCEGGVIDKKYRFGALALLFPILYCVFDTVGTAADGIILNEETGLGIGEIDVLILYGLTFLLAGIAAWIFLFIKEKKAYNPFGKGQLPKAEAAVCEEFGQIFYVYAMAARPVVAAPMIASYCVISVLLSRIFLKEKLKASQYACVFSVIAGIIILGISEGLGEL